MNKFLGPRTVIIQNNKQSFLGFYDKVKTVINNQQIFVSNQIFSELWDRCKANNGFVNVITYNNQKIIYTLQHKNRQNLKEKMILCVHCGSKPQKKIQLLHIETPQISYKYNPNAFQDSFYISRNVQHLNTLEK